VKEVKVKLSTVCSDESKSKTTEVSLNLVTGVVRTEKVEGDVVSQEVEYKGSKYPVKEESGELKVSTDDLHDIIWLVNS